MLLIICSCTLLLFHSFIPFFLPVCLAVTCHRKHAQAMLINNINKSKYLNDKCSRPSQRCHFQHSEKSTNSDYYHCYFHFWWTGQLLHRCTLRLKKNIPDVFDSNLKNQLSNFDNFWYEYSWQNLPSNYRSVSHLTQCMLLHYLEKSDQVKYVLK